MKSQDILLLLKLVSLERQQSVPVGGERAALGIPDDWRGWAVSAAQEDGGASGLAEDAFSVRGLEESTGISKSEVSQALRRCADVGLVVAERGSGIPRANTRALLGFVMNGLKYVFPARPGPIVRGIPTAHAAPVLVDRLLSAGEHIYVWEDGYGSEQGQRVEPLYKSVPRAVRRDAELYAMLALVDAIRLGRERESALAGSVLTQYLREVP
ncbi:helix-turn-helix domain-containing protein [Xanthomonas euvesicatoria]|uniref:helix-turn-helix domain-containing protein n=1 Tax=Xanthomonas euvesicatoria TaxID=456327 RepID=UPI0004A435C1|nr:helix-turn-helix domain-containing protein [Xanthomonas euvesicatoria]MCC8911993.1 helix-turn-helix domain-containing protein [Xanthomonas euvesicatoria]QTK48701.1 helix-turn-helix transcriptional regulator [Xanthomonas euvesicatoria pv. alfalfae]